MKAFYVPYIQELPVELSTKIVAATLEGNTQIEIQIGGDSGYFLKWDKMDEHEEFMVVTGLRIEK